MRWTAGLLLTAVKPFARALLVVLVLWSAVGGSAAWTLGMTPDLMLIAAGVLLVVSSLANLNPIRTRT